MKNLIILLAVGMCLTSCWDFNREQDFKDAENKGKSILVQAESSKKAKIEQAKADYESAQLEAKTRAIKAESKANSIRVISNAIKENPEYTTYQLIESVKTANRIYVATEAGIPILERK